MPEPGSESCDDVLAVGAISITEIEKLMEELQIARDYLQSMGMATWRRPHRPRPR